MPKFIFPRRHFLFRNIYSVETRIEIIFLLFDIIILKKNIKYLNSEEKLGLSIN